MPYILPSGKYYDASDYVADGSIKVPVRTSVYHKWNGTEWVKSAELMKADKISEIEKSYREFMVLPISYMGTVFQADTDSQMLIAQVLVASGGVLPANFAWYDINNEPVQMTYQDLQGLAGLILMRGQQHFYHKQVLKAVARNATTVAELEGITW